MSNLIILVDFDGTIAARAADRSGNIVYNDALIESLIEAQRSGMFIIGFTSWSHENYSEKLFRVSPARSAIIQGLVERGLEFDAVVTSGTYFSVINQLYAANKCNLDAIKVLNDTQRLEYLGHFFNTHIYDAEQSKNYTYLNESQAIYPQDLYEQLKMQEDLLDTGHIQESILALNKEFSVHSERMRLTTLNKDTEKKGMLQVVELIFTGSKYRIHLLCDDKSEPLNYARTKGYGECLVILDNTDPSYKGICRNTVEYKDFFNDSRRANAIENLNHIIKAEIPETLKDLKQELLQILELFSVEMFENLKKKCGGSYASERTQHEQNTLFRILKSLEVFEYHPTYLLSLLDRGQKAARVAKFVNERLQSLIPTGAFKLFELGFALNEAEFSLAENTILTLNEHLKPLHDAQEVQEDICLLIHALMRHVARQAHILECKRHLLLKKEHFAPDGNIERLNQRFNALITIFPDLDYQAVLQNPQIIPILRLANFLNQKLFISDTDSHLLNAWKYKWDAESSEKLARELLESLVKGTVLGGNTRESLIRTNFFASKIFKNMAEVTPQEKLLLT